MTAKRYWGVEVFEEKEQWHLVLENQWYVLASDYDRLQDEWRRMDLNLQAKVKYCEALEKRLAERSHERS